MSIFRRLARKNRLSKNLSARGLKVEALESRLLLAADLNVFYLGGDGVQVEVFSGETPVDLGFHSGANSMPAATFVLRNEGDSLLALSGISLPEGYVLVDGLGTSESNLEPGQEAQITVQPDNTAGSKWGDVIIANNSDLASFSIPMRGYLYVTGVPEISVWQSDMELIDNPASPAIDFGTVVQSEHNGVMNTFTVRNDGQEWLYLYSVDLPEGLVMTEELDWYIAPGGSDTFTVQLYDSWAGEMGGSLIISNNDSDESSFEIPVSGYISSNPPEIGIVGDDMELVDGQTAPVIDFGQVSYHQPELTKTFMVYNTGPGILVLDENIDLPYGFYLLQGPGQLELNANDSTTFTVGFDSTLSAGIYSGNAVVYSNDSDESSFEFPLTAELRPNPAEIGITINEGIIESGVGVYYMGSGAYVPVDFGTATQSFSDGTSCTFVIRNEGETGVLSLDSYIYLPEGFVLTDGLDYTEMYLAPGSSAAITVTLQSIWAGEKWGSIYIYNDDANENPFEIPVTGMVTPNPPEIAVSVDSIEITSGQENPIDFGIGILGQAGPEKTFTITNQNQGPLVLTDWYWPNGFWVTDWLDDSELRLEAGESAVFTLQVDSVEGYYDSPGLISGEIVIECNDDDENPFFIPIQATLVSNQPPEMDVLYVDTNGVTVAVLDGRSRIDFGTTITGTYPSPQITLLVINNGAIGGNNLELTMIGLPGGFQMAEPFYGASLPADGGSTFITVEAMNLYEGTYSGSLELFTNDPDENPFDLPLLVNVTSNEPVYEPEIRVTSGDQEFWDGQTVYDFGTLTQWQSGTIITFTIEQINEGEPPLMLLDLDWPEGLTLVDGISEEENTLWYGETASISFQVDTYIAGTVSGEVLIYSNDPDENPFNIPVTGTIETPALIGVFLDKQPSPQSIADGQGQAISFGSVQQGKSGPVLQFIISNIYDDVEGPGLSLGNLEIPNGFTLMDGLDDSEMYLYPGESALFSIQMTTNTVGTHGGTVEISYWSYQTDGVFDFPITGTVTSIPVIPDVLPPEISVSAAGANLSDGQNQPVDLGTGTEGQTGTDYVFTVRNDGQSSLILSSLTLPDGLVLVEGLNTSLGAGASDTFTVRLDTQTVRTINGEIRIANNDSNENPFNFPVTGKVIGPEIAVWSETAELTDGQENIFDFGTEIEGQTGTEYVFIVRNDGQSPLFLDGLLLPEGLVLVEGLNTSLEAGASDTFTVRLDTQAVRAINGEIRIANNDSNENPFQFPVTGKVIGPEIAVRLAALDITDGQATVIDFGTAGWGGAEPPQFVFTVKNLGDGDLILGGLSLPAGFTLVESADPVLEPGTEDTFTVRLDTDTPGLKAGVISLSNNDSTENPFVFPITGLVAAPEVTVLLGDQNIVNGQTTAIDFGTIGYDEPAPSLTFTVRNDGNYPLNLGSVILPAGYELADGLLESLQPGEMDTFTVRLDTGTEGTQAGQLRFVTNDPDENPFSFEITGHIACPNIIVLAGSAALEDGQSSPISFGNTNEGWTPPAVSFTVRNEGDMDLHIDAITLPAGYSLVEGLAEILAPGASDTFIIQMDTATAGIQSGWVQIANSDADKNIFDFSVTGEVFAVEVIEDNSARLENENEGLVIVSLTGPGTLNMYRSESQPDRIENIVLTDTTDKSALSIKTKGDAYAVVGSIFINGSLGKLSTKETRIENAIIASGGIEALLLDDLAGTVIVSTDASVEQGIVLVADDIGSGAVFDFSGPVRLFRAGTYPSGSLTAGCLRDVVIKEGNFAVDVTASAGSVLNLRAAGDITGDILAMNKVGLVKTPQGTLSATVRGQTIGTIHALNLNNAMLSAGERIHSVKIQKDVIDSYILAGYDIGMDGLPGAGDLLHGGDIGKFRFGGEFRNSHVAIGVTPIYSSLFPQLSGGSSSREKSSATITPGKNAAIVTGNDGQKFGFYFDAGAGSKLQLKLAAQDDFVIVDEF